MAHYYSSLYEQAPYRGGTPVYIPRNINVDRRSGDFAEFFTVLIPSTVVLAPADIIHLIPSTPAGFRVTRLVENGGDWETGTAALAGNIGFLSQALGVGVETASSLFTLLRSGGQFTLSDTAVLTASAAVGPQAATLNLLPAATNDELIMYVTVGATSAGPATAAQTANFLIEAIYP